MSREAYVAATVLLGGVLVSMWSAAGDDGQGSPRRMLSFGRRTCLICGVRGRTRGGFRTPDRFNLFICGACYTGWDRRGRTCAECGSPVRGAQEAGAFVDRRELGHADCGALRLFTA